jgi:hypothetical protein
MKHLHPEQKIGLFALGETGGMITALVAPAAAAAS